MPAAAQFTALQTRLGYTFRDPALFTAAVTHASYLQDHPETTAHNQRLEFLGDAVLHLILTDALFRIYPDDREGLLSRRRAALSKGGFLCGLARELGVEAAVRLSTSEEETGGRGRDSIMEDALEAIVGAIYLDSDFATVQRTVLVWYGPLPVRLVSIEDAENPKGRLQELVQPQHGNTALRYDTTDTSGPRHAREFTVSVFLQDRKLGEGHGSSKKQAEEAAARVALVTLRESGA
ncbi:MAG: ribonuclease III [Opitutales bacterium]